MGLLLYTQNCGLRMRRECRKRFPRHRHYMKPLVSDPGMHHGTCVTHVPRCMSGSLNRGGGENVPGIPSACATRNFTPLVRGSCNNKPCFHHQASEFMFPFIQTVELISTEYHTRVNGSIVCIAPCIALCLHAFYWRVLVEWEINCRLCGDYFTFGLACTSHQ